MKILPVVIMGFTLPKTNRATENRPSQKEISVPLIQFQVPKCQFQGMVISPFKIFTSAIPRCADLAPKDLFRSPKNTTDV